MKQLFAVLTIASVAGCASTESKVPTAPSKPSEPSRYEQQALLPEVQAGLVKNYRGGAPYIVNFSTLETFALSGDLEKEALVRHVYANYIKARQHYEQNIFNPEKLAAAFSKRSPKHTAGTYQGPLAVMALVKPHEEVAELTSMVNSMEVFAMENPYLNQATLLHKYLNTRVYMINVGADRLIVEAHHDRLYVLQGSTFFPEGLGIQYYAIIDGKVDRGTHDFFRFAGDVHKVKATLMKGQRSVPKSIGQFYDLEAGRYDYVVEVAGHSLAVPIVVEELNVRKGASVDSLIAAYGLPDEKRNYNGFWPCSITVNGETYIPQADPGYVSVSHWRFKRFPGLGVEIMGESVSGVFHYNGENLQAMADDHCR